MAKGNIKKFRLNETDDIIDAVDRKKRSEQRQIRERSLGGFACVHCSRWISIDHNVGTHNRNHCPTCLWSRHMDGDKPGDRKSECHGAMEPIALALKAEGADKYSASLRMGELMLVHECLSDGKIRINRIAGDDNVDSLQNVFYSSQGLSVPERKKLEELEIEIATLSIESEITAQLIGRL